MKNFFENESGSESTDGYRPEDKVVSESFFDYEKEGNQNQSAQDKTPFAGKGYRFKKHCQKRSPYLLYKIQSGNIKLVD